MGRYIDTSVTPADGDVLTYDGDTGKYAPAAPSGGGSGVQVATVPVSSAELLALHATPKTLVAAAAGQLILPLFLHFRTPAHATPYDTSGSIVQVAYELPDGDPVQNVTETTIWRSDGAATDVNFQGVQWDESVSATDRGLALVLKNAGSALTAGNGTTTVSVGYLLV